jgi:hypothetical protein
VHSGLADRQPSIRLLLNLHSCRPGGDGAEAVLTIGDPQPAIQTRLGDLETTSDLRDRLVTMPGNRDHVATELPRIWGGHDDDPSSEAGASP